MSTTEADWTFLSSHAHVLVCLAENPQAKLRDRAVRRNLFIALIVNSMQMVHEQDHQEVVQAQEMAHDEREQLMEMVGELRLEVRQLSDAMQQHTGREAIERER